MKERSLIRRRGRDQRRGALHRPKRNCQDSTPLSERITVQGRGRGGAGGRGGKAQLQNAACPPQPPVRFPSPAVAASPSYPATASQPYQGSTAASADASFPESRSPCTRTFLPSPATPLLFSFSCPRSSCPLSILSCLKSVSGFGVKRHGRACCCSFTVAWAPTTPHLPLPPSPSTLLPTPPHPNSPPPSSTLHPTQWQPRRHVLPQPKNPIRARVKRRSRSSACRRTRRPGTPLPWP